MRLSAGAPALLAGALAGILARQRETTMKTRDIVTEEWRMPAVPDGHEILFTEGGRIRDKADGSAGTTFQSHSFRVTQESSWSGITLRVRHGGGDESWFLGYCHNGLLTALQNMSSDDRYFVLYALMRQRQEERGRAYDSAALEYRTAFAEGRLKKRKVRGQDAVKVWIEPKIITTGDRP